VATRPVRARDSARIPARIFGPNALGETLAISLLGTLLVAVLALPLGFLAARNVVAATLLNFAPASGRPLR
jgi:hypothetical protein